MAVLTQTGNAVKNAAATEEIIAYKRYELLYL
jgi:hypothetical protein